MLRGTLGDTTTKRLGHCGSAVKTLLLYSHKVNTISVRVSHHVAAPPTHRRWLQAANSTVMMMVVSGFLMAQMVPTPAAIATKAAPKHAKCAVGTGQSSTLSPLQRPLHCTHHPLQPPIADDCPPARQTFPPPTPNTPVRPSSFLSEKAKPLITQFTGQGDISWPQSPFFFFFFF